MIYIERYSEDSVYLSATSKLPVGTPSQNIYDILDIGLIIDSKTGIIEDISITLLTKETIKFLKQLIIGFNLHEENIEILLDKIKSRYFGSAQKAVCVALKRLSDNYLKCMKKV